MCWMTNVANLESENWFGGDLLSHVGMTRNEYPNLGLQMPLSLVLGEELGGPTCS